MGRGVTTLSGLVLATYLFCCGPCAEPLSSQAKAVSNFGSVQGRVFAITQSGDLKPGRLAGVYLVFVTRIIGHRVDPAAENDETAGLVFLQKHLERMKKAGEEVQEPLAACRASLLAVDGAILETLEWTKTHKGQVLLADADEEGNFGFTRVRPGKYYAIGRGRAGISDVYWKQDVWIQPGERTVLKLSSVESACAD